MLTVVNGILGALVGVTGGCAVFNVYSSLIVGAVGSFVANITPPLLDYWKVGDIESRDSNKGPHHTNICYPSCGSIEARLPCISNTCVHVQVDDAVGATCVHGFGGMWGMIAIGLFAQKDEMTDVGYSMYVRL